MANEELWPNFSLRIGSKQRPIYVIDDFMHADAVDGMYQQFLKLPYVLGDSDRPDTAHVRHLVRPFDLSELEGDTPLANFTGFVRRFLGAQGETPGAAFRAYANFNLHGDYQFTHEDGPYWTALFFVNARWEEDWGGELLLYGDKHSDPGYAIFPKPGRLVVFDGWIRHRGGVPSKHCFEPRISLAIKLRREEPEQRPHTVNDSIAGDARPAR